MIKQVYTINLVPEQSAVVRVNVSQFDTGTRNLTFRFLNGLKQFTIPSDVNAKIRGLKGDNNLFEYSMETTDTTASVVVQEQMTVLAGEVLCEIVFYKDSDELATANFLLVVENSPLDQGKISETDVPAINTLIKGGEEGQVLTWGENGAEWAEGGSGASVHADTTANWNAQPTLVAKNNHIYVYLDYTVIEGSDVPAIKIGDGTSYLIDMPFVSGNNDVLSAHIADNVRHITAEERALWNSKVTCFVSQDDPTNLVFTTEREEDYNA